MNRKLFLWIVLALSILIVALLAAIVRLGTLFVASTRPLPSLPRPDGVEVAELPSPTQPLFPSPPLPYRGKPFVSATKPIPAPGHWPQWRGPRRDNVSTETRLLKAWPEDGPPLLWQADGIGEGKGGIAVAGGLVFLLGYRDGLEFLSALDGAGRTAWSVPIGAAVNEVNHMRWLSQRTPTVDDDRVYALTARGTLLCLDSANGDLLWQRDYGMDFGGRPGTWGGYCDFPLVDGPVVICAPSGPKSTVVALDRRTGATVWACDVPTTSLGTQSTLIPCVLAGLRQYVIQLDCRIVGISAENGRLLWSHPMTTSHGVVQVAIPRGDRRVVSLDGWGNAIEMLELVQAEGRLTPKVLYHEDIRMNAWLPNELLFGERLYTFPAWGSSFDALDLQSGEKVLKAKVDAKIGPTTMSDGLFYLRSSRGTMALAEPAADRLVVRSTFEAPHGNEDTFSFPVIAGGRLYLRDQGRLLCYDLRTPEYKETPPLWPIASRVRPRSPAGPAPDLARPHGEPDAIFVPTPMDVVAKMLELAGVTKDDRIVDLGSGDGRILIAASGTYGCRSVGYEIDPALVRESRARIRDRGLAALAVVEDRDLFEADLSSFSVVTLYLGEKNNSRLLPQLLKLKPGSRIVSHAHELGIPSLEPDKFIEMHSLEDGTDHRIYRWTTPLPTR